VPARETIFDKFARSVANKVREVSYDKGVLRSHLIINASALPGKQLQQTDKVNCWVKVYLSDGFLGNEFIVSTTIFLHPYSPPFGIMYSLLRTGAIRLMY